MELSPGLLEKLEEIKNVDVVVGILTKNVEPTILHVLNVVNEGVIENLSRYNTLIVVSDGFSTDRTAELARLFDIEPVKKIVTEQMGEPGKGNGIRTVLEIANHLNARAVGLIDGDLLSIKPEWIQELIQPILYGRTDLVIPFYVRDRFDGVITNNLAYPFTRAFYGMDVRQPIGGDFGISQRLMKILREHPKFPPDFGIDIFITTVAEAERQKIREAMLGLKLHESTTKYMDPESSLIPMFRQVVGAMLELAKYNREKGHTKRANVESEYSDYIGPTPVPITVDRDKLIDMIKARYSEFDKVYRRLFPTPIYKEVNQLAIGEANLDSELWSRCVWWTFKAYSKKSDIHLIDALRVLWIGRFVSYYDECKDMDIFGAEAVIRKQARMFEITFDEIIK
jgi:glycosyltransferase involved in cell wall biosynthesis